MPTLSKKSADKFIEILIDKTPLLKLINFVVMNDPVSSYPLLTLGRFKTRAVNKNQVAALQNPGEIMINFNAKELVLPLIISDSYIEDMQSNHERVANYVARAFGLDLQYLFVCGDTNSGGGTDKEQLAAAMDGIQTQLVNAGKFQLFDPAKSVLEMIKELFTNMPDLAVADPDLKILIGTRMFTSLWDSIATRSADKALLIKGDKIMYRGKEVIEVPDMSGIVIINPEHIVAGLCRDISIEQQRYPEARGNKVVCSARVDFQVVTEHALAGFISP